jgi:hypothetical protein
MPRDKKLSIESNLSKKSNRTTIKVAKSAREEGGEERMCPC